MNNIQIITNLILLSKCSEGYYKLNGHLNKYQSEKGHVKSYQHTIECNNSYKSINYPFLDLEITKIIHDLKNLLNPLSTLLQNDDKSNTFLQECAACYQSDFEKVISHYESIRKKLYNQDVNLLTVLDLYLDNFIILDPTLHNFKINLGDFCNKINNLYLYDPNFIVTVKKNSHNQVELNKESI
uniref:Uncharacterized protein n=1 Tax=viral metagenome TaxID=1070528 RepID=A0A6C0E5V6_9ZZZZ